MGATTISRYPERVYLPALPLEPWLFGFKSPVAISRKINYSIRHRSWMEEALASHISEQSTNAVPVLEYFAIRCGSELVLTVLLRSLSECLQIAPGPRCILLPICPECPRGRDNQFRTSNSRAVAAVY